MHERTFIQKGPKFTFIIRCWLREFEYCYGTAGLLGRSAVYCRISIKMIECGQSGANANGQSNSGHLIYLHLWMSLWQYCTVDTTYLLKLWCNVVRMGLSWNGISPKPLGITALMLHFLKYEFMILWRYCSKRETTSRFSAQISITFQKSCCSSVTAIHLKMKRAYSTVKDITFLQNPLKWYYQLNFELDLD